MELREYNLLRQAKHNYRCLPNDALYLAHIKGEQRRAAKGKKLDKFLDICTVAVCLFAMAVVTYAWLK